MRCGRTYRGGFAANRVAEVAFRWHSGDWTMVEGVTCAREGERGSREGRGRRVGGAPQGMGAQRRGWGRSVGGTGEGERGRFALRGKGVFP